MAEAATVKNKRDGLIQVVRTAATYTVSIEPGDFSYGGGQYSWWFGLDRGDHVTPRRLDAQLCTFGWSVWLRDLGSTAHSTLPDICEEVSRSGSWWASNTTSTLSATSDVLSSDVVFTLDGSAVGDPDSTLTWDDAQLRGAFAEGDADTYTVTGQCAINGPALT